MDLHQHLQYLEQCQVSLTDLLIAVSLQRPNNMQYPSLYNDLTRRSPEILSSLYYNGDTQHPTLEWAHNLMCRKYSDAVFDLTHEEHGWHFNALHAKPEQIVNFRIESIARRICHLQPRLWSLISAMLCGQSDVLSGGAHGGISSEDLENDVEEPLVQEADEEDDEFSHRQRSAVQSTKLIKAVTLISIMMQSRQQKCNAFQSSMGIFLHSSNAPEKLIKVLARLGVSISQSSIHNAVHSLSRASEQNIQALGRTLLVQYAFDNFDVKFATGIPTVDGPSENLVHLTSGALLRLEHGATLEDLRCSRLIWERNPYNPSATDPRPFVPHTTYDFLFTLHPESDDHISPLTRQGRWRSWHAKRILFRFGPAYFRNNFEKVVAEPETVESIPIVKTEFMPFRAMDLNQSTVAGNIDAILDMLAQAAVGDPNAKHLPDLGSVDISEFVQAVNGDLGAMDRVLSGTERRALEMSPRDRLQFVAFVMGFFHLKMAAADAVWRLLVQPESARKDSTSFMAYVGRLRPRSSNKMINNATFRDQHELIGHINAILLLDAWRVEARKQGYLTLDAWAESSPTLAEVEAISDRIVTEYIEGEKVNVIFRMQQRPSEARDKQHENTMRILHYLLLYEELAYAMNAGDIGRVETLFQPWIQIFRATGKHKYANRMLYFMHQLYTVYPAELRRVIRYNILVNPTGRAHHFRAVDWVVELLNLYIKVIYGGEGSNYTKKRILEESPLVLIYRRSHANFEVNFKLSGLTTTHAERDMSNTFKAIGNYITSLEKGPNEVSAGRSSSYSIPDALEQGARLIEAGGGVNIEGGVAGGDDSIVETTEAQLWEEIRGGERTGVGDDAYWELNVALDVNDLTVDGDL